MKRSASGRLKRTAKYVRAAKPAPNAVGRCAAIFRNGRNQAVRLPQDLKFPDKVKEVRVRKQGDSILLSPVRPDWASFFSVEVSIPDDFLTSRNDRPPQKREPL